MQVKFTFIYSSFYEGFGFPPLEAAACDTPVIVSHGSSLPEIMGNAAIYIDPFNIADLAQAMERLLSDSALCDTLKTIFFVIGALLVVGTLSGDNLKYITDWSTEELVGYNVWSIIAIFGGAYLVYLGVKK